MNLTGAQLYSKAVKGLRSPGTQVFDQQFRLIFIYPMLFDVKLQGNYSTTLRSFLSVSMLKEIFINNALNIVAIASEDHPLVDERGKKLEIQQMVKSSIISSSNRPDKNGIYIDNNTTNSSPRFPVTAYDLQQKIKEKTAIIKQYLANESRIKKLNPYVEIITLDNMIDVPVIVGTKDYQVDTLTLAFILATALSLKKPLNNWINAQFVFSVIENTKTEDAWKLFIGFVDKQQSGLTQRLIDYLTPNHPKIAAKLVNLKTYLDTPIKKYKSLKDKVGYVSTFIPRRSPLPTRPDTNPKVLRDQGLQQDKNVFTGIQSGRYNPDFSFKETPRFDIMKIVKTNLSDAKLFFKFMLDDDLLRSQFGLDRSPGQMATAVRKVSPHTKSLLQQSHHSFMQYMGQNVNSFMSQVFWLIYPWNTAADYSKLQDTYIDTELANEITTVIDELGSALQDTFGGVSLELTPEQRTKNLSLMCQSNLGRLFKELGDLGDEMDKKMGEIRSHVFSETQFRQFEHTYDKILSKFYNINARMERNIISAIKNPENFLKLAKSKIAASIDKMFKDYNEKYTDRLSNISLVMNPSAVDNDGNPIPMVPVENIPAYINDLRDALIVVTLAHFYVSMLTFICGFVEYIDVEVETVINDALDLPNYTLVIPVETVAMLHSAVISNSWKDLISQNRSENTNLTDNYIKGIVKFINKRLEIPNLIVLDTKKEQVYYKFQYMSAVNKSNISTFKTYIDNMTKSELKENPY